MSGVLKNCLPMINLILIVAQAGIQDSTAHELPSQGWSDYLPYCLVSQIVVRDWSRPFYHEIWVQVKWFLTQRDTFSHRWHLIPIKWKACMFILYPWSFYPLPLSSSRSGLWSGGGELWERKVWITVVDQSLLSLIIPSGIVSGSIMFGCFEMWNNWHFWFQ